MPHGHKSISFFPPSFNPLRRGGFLPAPHQYQKPRGASRDRSERGKVIEEQYSSSEN
jgi:hypothetical protein